MVKALQCGVLAKSLLSSTFDFRPIGSVHRQSHPPHIDLIVFYKSMLQIFFSTLTDPVGNHYTVPCSSWELDFCLVSAALIKKKKPAPIKVGGEKGLFHLMTSRSSTIWNRRNPRRELKSYTWSKEGMQKSEGRAPLTGLIMWPDLLLILPRTNCAGVVLPTICCVLQPQLLTEDMTQSCL